MIFAVVIGAPRHSMLGITSQFEVYQKNFKGGCLLRAVLCGQFHDKDFHRLGDVKV